MSSPQTLQKYSFIFLANNLVNCTTQITKFICDCSNYMFNQFLVFVAIWNIPIYILKGLTDFGDNLIIPFLVGAFVDN